MAIRILSRDEVYVGGVTCYLLKIEADGEYMNFSYETEHELQSKINAIYEVLDFFNCADREAEKREKEPKRILYSLWVKGWDTESLVDQFTTREEAEEELRNLSTVNYEIREEEVPYEW